VVAAWAVVANIGCSSSTTLLVTTNVEDFSVPFVTELGYTVTSVGDPSHTFTQSFISTVPGLVDGDLPPLQLPDQRLFTIDPSSFSGEVVVVVEGINNITRVVRARGQSDATIVPQQQTQVTVTLHGLTGCATDAGATDSGALDAGPSCDGSGIDGDRLDAGSDR
jgi:hypothetical protein